MDKVFIYINLSHGEGVYLLLWSFSFFLLVWSSQDFMANTAMAPLLTAWRCPFLRSIFSPLYSAVVLLTHWFSIQTPCSSWVSLFALIILVWGCNQRFLPCLFYLINSIILLIFCPSCFCTTVYYNSLLDWLTVGSRSNVLASRFNVRGVKPCWGQWIFFKKINLWLTAPRGATPVN